MFLFHAPVLILAANQKDYCNNMADCACALENMMLMANALDLGSCWVNQLKWLNENPDILTYLQKLGLKEEERIYGGLVIGHPNTPDGLPIRNPLPRKGNEVTVIGGEAISRIGNAEVVLTNKTPITRKVIDACPSMKFISLLATGYNVVDYVYAGEKGIPVTNVPTYGTASVGQFAIALLLEICHHIGHHNESVHRGDWENCADWCYWDYPLIELDGKTMGIIGFGRIGQTTGRIAKALGMKVLAYDGHPNKTGRDIGEYAELDTLLRESDVIALHCPLFPVTQGIINKETIAKMKDGVILLNNSRGPLVVEQDLADALNSGKVAAAGLDVVSTEPIKGDNLLLKARNCIITPPHLLGPQRESAADHGLCGGQCEGISGRCPHQCGERIRNSPDWHDPGHIKKE